MILDLKNRKAIKNKVKPHGRERKLFASIMLILRLLFGGSQYASASSNSKSAKRFAAAGRERFKVFGTQTSAKLLPPGFDLVAFGLLLAVALGALAPGLLPVPKSPQESLRRLRIAELSDPSIT